MHIFWKNSGGENSQASLHIMMVGMPLLSGRDIVAPSGLAFALDDLGCHVYHDPPRRAWSDGLQAVICKCDLFLDGVREDQVAEFQFHAKLLMRM